jgi:hypothetical protein
MFGFPLDKTAQGRVTVLVGGGVFEPNTVEAIKYPSDGIYFKGWFDNAYDYPTTQRSYIISSVEEESEANSSGVVVPSRDGVPMQFDTAAYFKLNEELIGDFHTEIGIKTQAWTDKGWDRMLTQYFRKIEEDTIRNFAQQYTVDDLYCPNCADGGGDSVENLLAEAELEIGTSLQDRLTQAQGQEYFCGPATERGGCTDIQFVINNVRPANPAVLAKYAELRTSDTEIDIQRNNVKASRLQAQAARELTRRGVLSDEYVRLRYIDALREAVEHEGVDFWVLNGEENVTLPAPRQDDGGGGG